MTTNYLGVNQRALFAQLAAAGDDGLPHAALSNPHQHVAKTLHTRGLVRNSHTARAPRWHLTAEGWQRVEWLRKRGALD